MATIRRMPSGKWQAQIARKGVRRSKVFRTKLEARDWAARQEHLILSGSETAATKRTFADLLQRYAKDVSPGKRGARWEILRINKFCRTEIAATRLSDLTPERLAQWRDKRVREVSAASVKREMQLLSAALNVARREWGWIDANPLSSVRKPPSSAPRERRIGAEEMAALISVCGSDLSKLTGRIGIAFLFAIETALRAGEIIGLEWPDIDFETRVAHLTMTKNGTAREGSALAPGDRTS